MAGKQAKLLSDGQQAAMLRRIRRGRYRSRDRVIILLSTKAGMRAGEIAKLTWPMVLDSRGRVSHLIELEDRAAKMRGGRSIPLHPTLRKALAELKPGAADLAGPVVYSERGGQMQAKSIVNWFTALFKELGYAGCSSHSGRRTFITRAARLTHRSGGSLRDVQQLAGHRSIEMTQRYIEGDTLAKRRIVNLI
jgi:integrase